MLSLLTFARNKFKNRCYSMESISIELQKKAFIFTRTETKVFSLQTRRISFKKKQTNEWTNNVKFTQSYLKIVSRKVFLIRWINIVQKH